MCFPAVASGIDREQDRESYTASHKADDSNHLEEPKVKVSIERLVVEDVFVLDAPERLQPAELFVGQLFRFFTALC